MLVPAPPVEQTQTFPMSLRAWESFRMTHPAGTVNVQFVASLPAIVMPPGNWVRLFQQVDGTHPAPLSGATSTKVEPLRSNCARKHPVSVAPLAGDARLSMMTGAVHASAPPAAARRINARRSMRLRSAPPGPSCAIVLLPPREAHLATTASTSASIPEGLADETLCLRHTAATLLLAAGVHPKVVSEMFGHSSVTIALDLDSHVTPTMQQQAVSVLGSRLSAPVAVTLAVNGDPDTEAQVSPRSSGDRASVS